MAKISNDELMEYAEIYNKNGKKELYLQLAEKHGIKNPTCVFNRMCRKSALAYDKDQDRFLVAQQDDTGPEDVFMSMDELCAPRTQKSKAGLSERYEQKRDAEMDKMIRELIGDRLLELSRYVALDSAAKIMHVDESSLKNDGYQVLIH